MCAVNTRGASALASVGGPGTGAPYWSALLATSAPTSVLLSQQTDETRNLGTAGFANESDLQQPWKGRESTLCS